MAFIKAYINTPLLPPLVHANCLLDVGNPIRTQGVKSTYPEQLHHNEV